MSKIKAHFATFIKKNGLLFGIIRILFYPVTQLFITPVKLLTLLYKSIVLLDGKWGNYGGFISTNTVNHFFYWTRALNLYRYGRSGNSPYIGLGNYPLSRCFHYTLPSLYAFWIAPTVTVLTGIIGWLLVHLIWINYVSFQWVLIIMFLSFISNSFYLNIIRQNYNALGWIFFPLGLLGLFTGNWIIAGLCWFLASYFSFTIVALAVLLSIPTALQIYSLMPFITVIPAIIKLLFNFVPFIQSGNIKSILQKVMKAIGITNKGVKYKRKQSKGLNIVFIYFLILYIQFLLVCYWRTNTLCIYFFTGIIVYLLNGLFIRFADFQSINMLIFSLGLFTIIQYSGDIWLLISYWILISPFPLATDRCDQNNPDILPTAYPLDISPLIDKMQTFFEPVSENKRVLISFDDPQNIYENVFDGYRRLLEVPHYYASVKKFRLFPDWWGVFELNYDGAPDFWGRDVKSVTHYCPVNIKIKSPEVRIYNA